MQQLAVAAFNSVTFACAEVMGRSYGGGILELEPTEAEALPTPDPSGVPLSFVVKIDELVRDGRSEEALRLVDERILVDQLGFSSADVQALNEAWSLLRDRRNSRGKGKR